MSAALELAGLMDAFEGRRTVLLKPNLLSARQPEEAVTTHPAVVEALGEIARRAGCRILLGDSPPFAGENPARYAALLDRTGMSEVARRIAGEIVRFESDVVRVSNPSGKFYRSFEIGRPAQDSDLIVSISKLKTHGLTGITGAIKNLFGCVPGIRKGLFHVQAAENRQTFAQMLVDLAGAFPRALHIMDAVTGMDGDGPTAGRSRKIGLILASSDSAALDAVASAIAGMDPMSIDTTRLAHEQGLGCGELDSIQIRGEPLQDVRIPDFAPSSGVNDWARIPRPVRNLLRRKLLAVPEFSGARCAGCGECAEACPVDAITPGKPPSVDLSVCIRCYCCHEVCGHSAVRLKRGLLSRMLQKR
ncbi:MAG: DUF362 domain-containing protein [Armatimonadota bacterium]